MIGKSILGMLVAGLVAMLPTIASATFIFEPPPLPNPPHSNKYFLSDAHHNVTSFDGHVGNEHSGPVVHATTNGSVDTGAGWSNITPSGGIFTSMTLTPENPFAFSDFSMRGQLASAGFFTISVTDSDGFTFTFTSGLQPPDTDVGRFGIISLDGETIQSITLSTTATLGFKELKQFAFSPAGEGVPDGGATVMLLGAALSLLGIARRFIA
jgi:hypothetical protein